MQPQHTLFVCTSCASVWKDGKTIGKSGGQQLLEQILQLYKNWDSKDQWQIQPVECMSACSHSCAISFAAIGKYTYLFGDLPYAEEMSAIADVFNCADKYYLSPDGLLPWSERPAALKKGVVARIPPLTINN